MPQGNLLRIAFSPNYVMRMMANGDLLLSDDISKETVIIWKENREEVVNKFKYKLPFDWHFRYLHTIEYHTNLRNTLPSI